MSIKEDLHTYITGKAAISALIGSRFYPMLKPQEGAFPAATYQFISTDNVQQLDGGAGIHNAIVDIDCMAYTLSQADTLHEAIRNALDGYENKDMGSTFINGCRLETIEDEILTNSEKSQRNIYRITMTFRIHYQITKPNNLN